MIDSIRAFFAREPVVVFNVLFGLAAVAHEAVAADVTAQDSWKVLGQVVLTALVRHFVTPAVDTEG